MLENPPPVVKLLPRSLWQATSSRPNSGPENRIKKYRIRVVSYLVFFVLEVYQAGMWIKLF